jgi:hypothetical protein
MNASQFRIVDDRGNFINTDLPVFAYLSSNTIHAEG